MEITINELDNLFKSYNYKVSSKSSSELRIYTLRYGMYHAAELIKLTKNIDVKKEKDEFSKLGYATEVKTFYSKDEIEEYLFEGFFIKTPLGNELKRRYKLFVNKQLRNLPDDSKYKYINSSYNLMIQDEYGIALSNESIIAGKGMPIINKINELLLNSEQAIFIIIEAPAGFGKTCTAFEILNTFSSQASKKLPFFSELSRNREARVFKHILLNEIDEQFPTGIKKNIVLEQISKGRIPLIIDGFDELISKDSSKEEVESMLTTIVDLLSGNAKVIVTARKTALFSSEEFFNSIDRAKNKFSVARFEIKEPTINNWLDKERIQLINSKNFPLDYLENPVLLSYLRNISFQKFNNYLSDNQKESIIDKYIDYLLKREQTRQNIKITASDQLVIFRKLVRFMTELDFTAENKSIIKDLIKEYNFKILNNSLKNYVVEEKPTFEDLIETISNHVFLDRKQSGDIGIINDFIFGILIAENLILGEYQKYYSNYNNMISQDFAYKAVQSFKIQTKENKLKLWKVFNNVKFPFDYDVNFFFHLDYYFIKSFSRYYSNLVIDDWNIDDITFNNSKFNQSIFSGVVFNNCFFDLNIFDGCSFQNCLFNNCSIIPNDCNNKHFNDFAILACNDNNGFIEKVYEKVKPKNKEIVFLSDFEFLSIFFQIKKVKAVSRKITYIKTFLTKYSPSQINDKITLLKRNKLIYFKGDSCFISREGYEQYQNLKQRLL